MQWQNFLQRNGAIIEDNHLSSFGQSEIETEATLRGNIITDLSHLSILEFSGEDAEEFLQGQLTNDIKSLGNHEFQMSTWCNIKGQVVTNFYIFRYQSGFLLLVPTDICEKFITRLKMYILRSDVSISDKSHDLICIGVSINDAEEQPENIFNDIPQHGNTFITTENYICLRVKDNKTRLIFIGDVDSIIDKWQKLVRFLTPVGTSQWELLDILAGIPWINSVTTETFIPQYLNLDILGAISFDKGCYLGQEIIARLHYRGKVKRRLHLASINSESAPSIGEDIYLKDSGDRSIGKIINLQPHPEYDFILLVVIEIEAVKEGDISLQDAQDHTLTFHDLPYTV